MKWKPLERNKSRPSDKVGRKWKASQAEKKPNRRNVGCQKELWHWMRAISRLELEKTTRYMDINFNFFFFYDKDASRCKIFKTRLKLEREGWSKFKYKKTLSWLGYVNRQTNDARASYTDPPDDESFTVYVTPEKRY